MALQKRKQSTYSMTVLGAIAGATLLGGFYGERLFGSPVQNDLQRRMKEYTELVTAASYWSAEEVGAEKLVYSSVEGMLRTLDPHSSFLEPRDYAEMQDRQKGTFFGLGILVTKRNNQVTVITPLENTPAARLGIRAGDIITEVEGTATDDLPLDDVVRRLKGPKGSTVHIKVMRIGIDEPIPMTIVRAAIPTNSISSVLMVKPEIGYIRIKDFTYTTVREFDEAVAKLEKQGMKKLILDMRQNPGGLLDAAVGVADHFVDKGSMIVYTRGRTPDSMQEFTAPGKHQKLNMPVVVLINHGSASASEIVAGAIQDHDRGLLVGQTSWGKGLVQSVYTLQYGAGLALTTSKYFTPAGRNIQRDYSSIYDYYVSTDFDANPDEQPLKDREVFTTDTGRKVYGGGGITPDFIVKPRDLSHVVQLLEMRSTIFNYAVEYFAKHPDLTKDVVITDAILRDFARYAVEKDIAPLSDVEAALKNADDRTYIERSLKAEIIAAKFNYDESYPYRLQGDDQVAKAIELFPEAEKLASKAAEARSQRLATVGTDPSGRASANKTSPRINQ